MVKASVIWLNYNSMNFIDIALRSLESFLDLDFDGYEVIIVDNASTDGSFERIKKFIEEHKPSSVRVRIIRNDENLGYAGGMNVGWDARDPDSKYVAFANNDLIPTPQSLTKLIEYMDGDERVGAVSGLIYYGDGKTIYSAGGWVNEIWFFDGICGKFMANECPGINKEHYVTYPDGAYMVTKVDAVRKAMPNGKPFIDETFLYLDDALLGLILWNKGCKIKYIPVTTGIHYAGKTTGITKVYRPSMGFYYISRGFAIFSKIIQTRYSHIRNLIISELLLASAALCKIADGRFCFYIYGYKDAELLADLIIYRIGFLTLYNAPYIKTDLLNLFPYILMYGYIGQGSHKTYSFEDFHILYENN